MFADTEAKIRAFVRDRFNNDPYTAWVAYSDGDDKWDRTAMDQFLTDAGVGGSIYRKAITRFAMAECDHDGDGFVSWDEVSEFLKG